MPHDRRTRRRQLRSSFGAIEDWNLEAIGLASKSVKIAIVFRGDRGLEQGLVNGANSIYIAIVFRGDRGLEPVTMSCGVSH